MSVNFMGINFAMLMDSINDNSEKQDKKEITTKQKTIEKYVDDKGREFNREIYPDRKNGESLSNYNFRTMFQNKV